MREVSKRRPLVCAEGLEMQLCAFCFSTERVVSICVNKEQRKLTLRANTVEEKRAEQVLASQKKKNWCDFSFSSVVSSFSNTNHEKRSKCPTKGRKRKDLLGTVPARPATWPVGTQFDFYVVGSVPRTLNNAVVSGMLHRVPARWAPESTQLEGKLCRSPMQINK